MLTNELRQNLIRVACEVRQRAYSPYSHYKVGAALLGKSGRIYNGINIENAVYPLGICAERVALFKAISEGEKSFNAIAVVTADGGSPCGGCRQVLSEFGLEIIVLIADGTGSLVEETTIAALLPQAFGPQNLIRSF
jgi:cytidine deaminase